MLDLICDWTFRGRGGVPRAEAAGHAADHEVAHAAPVRARQVRQRGEVRGGDGAAPQVGAAPGHLRAQRHAQRVRQGRAARRHGAPPRGHGARRRRRRRRWCRAGHQHVQRAGERVRARGVPGPDGGGVPRAGGPGARRRRGDVDIPHRRVREEEGVRAVPGDLRGDGGRRVLPGRRHGQGAARRVLRRAPGGAGHGHRQVHAQGRQDALRIMKSTGFFFILCAC